MNTNTYECSYVEVLEILKHIPQEQYNRIPEEKILFYEKNKNKEYKYIYNEQTPNLSRKAKIILVNIYKEYIANANEKNKIEKILELNNQKQEIEKQNKFNNTEIFKAMEDKYPKAYKEVIEILKFVPEEDLVKIPKEMIEMFNKKMDKNYSFTIDLEKEFEEQILLDETKAILANIFMDYWATDQQRFEIKTKKMYEMQKLEDEKKQKYNPDALFKKEVPQINKDINEKNKLPIELKKESFYKKIIKFFKKVFHIN